MIQRFITEELPVDPWPYPSGPKLTADLRQKKVETKCQKGAVHIFRGAHSTVRGTIHEAIDPACL